MKVKRCYIFTAVAVLIIIVLFAYFNLSSRSEKTYEGTLVWEGADI